MADWPRVLGLALTGEDLGPGGGEQSAAEVVDWLANHGWDAERLNEHRRGRQLAERPWPHQVPGDWVDSWARYGALLAEVRRVAGLTGLHATVHEGPRVLGPAERRLMADKPPHHL